MKLIYILTASLQINENKKNIKNFMTFFNFEKCDYNLKYAETNHRTNCELKKVLIQSKIVADG